MHTLLGFVLASLALGSATVEPSSHVHARAERATASAPFGVLVIVEDTRLIAISRSLEAVVLVLASPARGAVVARTLAPGATLETHHPPLGLAGLTLEVLAAPGGRLTSSGRLVLDGSTLALGIQASLTAAGDPRLTVAGDRAVVQRAGSLPFPGAAAQPLHVPIPSPDDKPPGNTPPPMEDEPLPPV